MRARRAYINIKRRNLEELNDLVAELDRSSATGVDKLHNACLSASSMLDRIINGDADSWKSLRSNVDGAFREAYDRLRRIRAHYQLDDYRRFGQPVTEPTQNREGHGGTTRHAHVRAA